MTQTKKNHIIRKKGQEAYNSNSDMKSENTTKENCRLQIQRQIELNETLGMDNKIDEEMYVNAMTEEEFDKKTESLLNLSFCKWLPYQKEKIKKVIANIKENGWFERFEYRDHKCAIELDDCGKWRIFVKPNKYDFLPFHASNFDFDYCSSSSRFGIPKFRLGLWWYGDKIGLDDFIGVSVFSYTSWQNYFTNDKFSEREEKTILDKQYMKKLCMELVDRIIDYQVKVEKEKKWKCDLCTMTLPNDDLIAERKKQHVAFHKVKNRNIVYGDVNWEVVINEI